MKRAIHLQHGSVLDGTGTPAFDSDVLLLDGRIAEIGSFNPPNDAEIIDCSGLTIAPGFIDAHSHSDLQVLERRPEKIRQGVTTQVVGNCGFSPYPAINAHRAELHEFANGIFCGSGDWGWKTSSDYLQDVAAASTEHVLSLVGHGSLRIAQAGLRNGALGESDLDAMEQMLTDALTGGACGFSTGLMYAPGESAPFLELERLLKVVARHDKIYATHMRDYARNLVAAVQEQLELAQRTGCRLQISHLQAVGKRNWPEQRRALDLIEHARQAGVDVAFDCYPYICGSTVLTQILPQWALEGGITVLLQRLADVQQRALIANATLEKLDHEWSDLSISSAACDDAVVGLTVAEIATSRGRHPMDTIFDLLIENEGAVNILERNQSEENLRESLAHELSIVISDGFYVKGRPHPRLHGTFPLLLGTMARDRGWLSLPDAVRKITSAPADRFQLRNRGRIAKGHLADVTVFDAIAIASPASYVAPEQPPIGIHHVFFS